MHSLNCSGKSNLEERPSVESSIEKLSEYRTEVIIFIIIGMCRIWYQVQKVLYAIFNV